MGTSRTGTYLFDWALRPSIKDLNKLGSDQCISMITHVEYSERGRTPYPEFTSTIFKVMSSTIQLPFSKISTSKPICALNCSPSPAYPAGALPYQGHTYYLRAVRSRDGGAGAQVEPRLDC